MFRKLTSVRFRVVLYLAVVLLLAQSVAFAQPPHTITVDETRPGDVYGNSSDESGDVADDVPHGNTVIVTGSVVENVYGARNDDESVTGNSVKINGGQVTKNVHGGYSNNGVVSG